MPTGAARGLGPSERPVLTRQSLQPQQRSPHGCHEFTKTVRGWSQRLPKSSPGRRRLARILFQLLWIQNVRD